MKKETSAIDYSYTMTTSCEQKPSLKFQVSQVKNLLNDASIKLTDEYQSNANTLSTINNPPTLLNGHSKEAPAEILTVLRDIRTLKSVLMCPIFERIVNVTESLNRLSDHLNLQPSLSSNEIDIDQDTGELTLTKNQDTERILVTLTKDANNSLGITIAGYTCEEEGISGIFIRRIMPNGPADESGKINAFDQIYSVNNRDLTNFSNKEAVEVLKQTGNVVTLGLVRYKTESKFNKLQSVLAKAVSRQNMQQMEQGH